MLGPSFRIWKKIEYEIPYIFFEVNGRCWVRVSVYGKKLSTPPPPPPPPGNETFCNFYQNHLCATYSSLAHLN